MLDERVVRVSAHGDFVFGFGRDANGSSILKVVGPNGTIETKSFKIKSRKYHVQRIDGLPKAMVRPPKHLLNRIQRENDEIKRLRVKDTVRPFFKSGFIWPAKGKISGVYGSQRILNGEPRQPHYGIDIAAPSGTPVFSPADAIVVLAETELYYSGGTLILDHGHGLSSALLHMKELQTRRGDHVKKGQLIGKIGSTGRSSGPHLDWRINWFLERLDPAFLVGRME